MREVPLYMVREQVPELVASVGTAAGDASLLLHYSQAWS